MAAEIIKPGLPPASAVKGNVASLVSNPSIISNLAASKGLPKTFGSQEKDLLKQKIIQSATKGRLAKLLKEKASLIKERIALDLEHAKYVNITLFQKKTPKKQIQDGKEIEIPAELTEEEYQIALIIENGGTLPNGQTVKGNYPTAIENIQKKQDENQKQINDFLRDPFATQKLKLKQFKLRLKATKKKTKAEKRKARKAKVKAILRNARKTLAPTLALLLSNKIAEVIAGNERIGKLVNDTNRIIEEANLSNNPIKLQNAKLARDNALRIITSNENKIRKIRNDIQRISTYISIFSIIVTIISAIPIPTAVPPGIGIPTNLIIKFVKILDKANRIVLILSAFLPSILMCLEKAISILVDYKSQLLNINDFIDKAASESITPSDFLNSTPTGPGDGGGTGTGGTGTDGGGEEFEEYKGFRFALKDENNPKFNVRGFKRKYAVAINKANVEVLKSEFSFTLDPNDLIEQLKLLIDQNNLDSSGTSQTGRIGTGESTSEPATDSGGGGGGNIPTIGGKPRRNTLLGGTPGSSIIEKARKAAFTQPPQPIVIKAGPFRQKIPLSVPQKAMYVGIAAGSPEPSSRAGAAIILKKNADWQRKYRAYLKSAGGDISNLPD